MDKFNFFYARYKICDEAVLRMVHSPYSATSMYVVSHEDRKIIVDYLFCLWTINDFKLFETGQLLRAVVK